MHTAVHSYCRKQKVLGVLATVHNSNGQKIEKAKKIEVEKVTKKFCDKKSQHIFCFFQQRELSPSQTGRLRGLHPAALQSGPQLTVGQRGQDRHASLHGPRGHTAEAIRQTG